MTNIEKDKNRLVCTFNTGKQSYFDFKTHETVGVSNKPITINSFKRYFTFEHSRSDLIAEESKKLYKIIRAILDWYSVPIKALCEAEPMLSYIDMIDENIPTYHLPFIITKGIKKGYIAYCRENNKKINEESMNEFEVYSITKGLSGDFNVNYKIIKMIKEKCNFDNFEELPKSMLLKIIKVIKRSFNNYEIPDFFTLSALLNDRHIFSLTIQYFDDNRSFEHNLKTLEMLRDKARNEEIVRREEKIKDLEELSLPDGLCISVPCSMKEFTIEGEQQNNCVGSYYHDNIARGHDLIYFIRRKDNADKSYVTCRYNTSRQKSVETRVKNNVAYHNDTLFEIIDKEIKKLLENA